MSRLHAADMVFRLSGGYRHNREAVAEEEPEPVIEINWEEYHPEVIKYFAQHGEWPSAEIEKRLINGEPLESLEQEGLTPELSATSDF